MPPRIPAYVLLSKQNRQDYRRPTVIVRWDISRNCCDRRSITQWMLNWSIPFYEVANDVPSRSTLPDNRVITDCLMLWLIWENQSFTIDLLIKECNNLSIVWRLGNQTIIDLRNGKSNHNCSLWQSPICQQFRFYCCRRGYQRAHLLGLCRQRAAIRRWYIDRRLWRQST